MKSLQTYIEECDGLDLATPSTVMGMGNPSDSSGDFPGIFIDDTSYVNIKKHKKKMLKNVKKLNF